MYRTLYGNSRREWFAFAVLASVIAASVVHSAAAQGGGGPPPALVRVGNIDKQTVGDRWEVVGRMVEVRRATVAAEQDGRIVEVHAEEGDVVIGGKTVLARIDDIWARLSLQVNEAALAERTAGVLEADAQVDQAKRDLLAREELMQTRSAKPKEVDDARSALAVTIARRDQARASVTRAEAEIALSRERIARLAVVAPFDGVVVKKLTEVGQWAQGGASIAEIISTGAIDAVINVPEKFINKLARGDEVEIEIEPLAMNVVGKVESLVPFAGNAARTFPVKVRLDDLKGQLKSGMSVTAHVPTGEQVDRLTVPRDAVQRGGGGDKVWLNLNGQALPLTVQVLFGVGDRYAIQPVGGPPAAPGMQVVIEGAERLFPTQPLSVVGHPTPTKAE